MSQQPLLKHAALVGGVAVLLYVACLAWRLTISEPAIYQLHMNLLKLTFPGFKNFDGLSMLWGGLMAFVYGFVAAVIWHLLHGKCCEAKE